VTDLLAVLPLATDWATISSLATAGGTLVLALATFASVRSANRSARIAEIALQEQRRPVLAPSRLEDPMQKIMFVEGRWVRAEGGRGVAEHEDGRVYLALSLRNVGSGIGVCQGWAVRAGQMTSRAAPTHTPEDQFRSQTRDLYIPAGDIGMWQGAIRSPDDPAHAGLVEAIEHQEPISIELLYSDQVGGQRTISRFGLVPGGEAGWFATLTRHWYLDAPGPRDEEAAIARVREILREQGTPEREIDEQLAR
jgi:hypothetical protein